MVHTPAPSLACSWHLILLLTAVAGLLLLASVERVLSAPDTYHVLLIARGQPSVNSAGFGLPEQLAPSAQLAML